MKKTAKRQLQVLIKKCGVSLLTLAFLSSSFPIYAYAATTASDGTQVSSYSSGISKTTSNNGSYSSIATETISCSAGKILANILTSAVSSVINTLTDKVVTKVVDTVKDEAQSAVTAVRVYAPTTNQHIDDRTSEIKAKQDLQNSATVGHATLGVLTTPGWDSIAYCIVNSVITYIADSTITWANSGFNGNPSFISNTGNFFETLADNEAGSFVSELAKNVTGGGINLCSNFKVEIAVGLSNYYSNSSFKNTASCSLSTISKNLDNFTTNFSDGGWNSWFSMTQNDQNNRYGATLLSTDELYARLSAKNNTAKLELGLNRGFLNYKKCDDKNDPSTCKTVTPGIVIQTELEKTLGLKKDRLVLAQKFDQVIEAIVNNLIKKGVSEVLSKSSN